MSSILSYPFILAPYPNPPSKLNMLTFEQVTNRFNRTHLGQKANKNFSPNHIAFTAVQGNFYIGNWTGEKHCPGIPIFPEVLEERESVHVDWVELEFEGDSGKY